MIFVLLASILFQKVAFSLEKISIGRLTSSRERRALHVDQDEWLKQFMHISSVSNPTVSLLKSLQERRYREQHGLILLEGHRQIIDSIKKGIVPLHLLFTTRGLESPFARDLQDIINHLPNEIVRSTTDVVMNKITDTITNQGIVAAFKLPQTLLLSEMRNSLDQRSKSPIVVIADNISDPGNLGTIIRTCYGFGVDGVISISGCDIWSPKVIRSSMGTCLSMPLSQSNWPEISQTFFSNSDYNLVLTKLTADSISYDSYNFTTPTVLVLGSEARGIDKAASTAANAARTINIRIPMSQDLESFNVGVAAAVIIGEASRQRRQSKQSQ